METLKDKFTRYGISTLITFLTAFGLAFLSSLQASLETGQPMTTLILVSCLSGAIFAGIRVVVKYLYEILSNLKK